MGGGQRRGADHKRRGGDSDSLHRAASTLTSDDAATVIGICVSLLVALTGVLAYIVCIGLLIVLSHGGLHWWKC